MHPFQNAIIALQFYIIIITVHVVTWYNNTQICERAQSNEPTCHIFAGPATFYTHVSYSELTDCDYAGVYTYSVHGGITLYLYLLQHGIGRNLIYD